MKDKSLVATEPDREILAPYGAISASELATFNKMQIALLQQEEKRHARRMDIATFIGSMVIVLFCLSAAFIFGLKDKYWACGEFLGAPVAG